MASTIGDLAAEARAECAARRARVLAHPDIARRLCERPLAYSSPDMWTGYIPPAEVPTAGGWKRNISPRRAQLVAICQAVHERETTLALGGGE